VPVAHLQIDLFRMARFVSFLVGLLCSPLLLLQECGAQRSVQVDLRAPAWARHAASPVAEVAEFVAEASADKGIWAFIEAACDSGTEKDGLITTNSSAEVLARSAIVLGHRSLPSSMHRLMETAVGLGIYQPAVQFFANLAKPFGDPCEGRAFAVHYPGEAIECDSASAFRSSLGEKADDPSKDTLDISGLEYPAPWDHAFPLKQGSAASADAASSSLWVVYGSVGSQSFCAMHRAAVSAGAGDTFRYSVRHAFPGSSPVASSTALQGYGVFLDIKNLEYKNIDDSSRPQGGGDAGSDALFTPGEEVKVRLLTIYFHVILCSEISLCAVSQGIDFSVIAAQHPELSPKLAALRDELAQAAAADAEGSEGTMKVGSHVSVSLSRVISVSHLLPIPLSLAAGLEDCRPGLPDRALHHGRERPLLAHGAVTA
jgi:hypothetical protein